MISYNVFCRIESENGAQIWLEWLRGGHIADVMQAGASKAEIVKHDKEGMNAATLPGTIYEIRYTFPSREAMDDYLANHALRLRTEGLERFPPQDGFHYSRQIGEILDSF